MRLLIVLCFAAGCGFASRASSGGAVPGDGGSAPLDARAPDAAALPDAAVVDDAGAGSGAGSASDCLQRWMDGTPQLASLRSMTELSNNSAERDPWISEDGLRLYFSRAPGPHGGADIYVATRASPTGSFTAVMDLANLNGAGDDDRPALSGDELTIVFARDPASGGGNAHIQLVRRSQRGDAFPTPPDEALVQAVNMDSADHFDPFLSRDGLRLYLAPRASGRQQIMMATRPGSDQAFSAPAAVRGVDRLNASDPALSSDERVLVFSSASAGGSGGVDLWYATRAEIGLDFAVRGTIPVNSAMDDGDPMLSADGCELYFSSTRGGTRHIWHADMKR